MNKKKDKWGHQNMLFIYRNDMKTSSEIPISS